MTPYTDLKAGTLLIACPEMIDGIFYRSVILLCDHSTIGSFGLIINKALSVELPDEILGINEKDNPHLSVRGSGPFQPSQMMLLHTSSHSTPASLQVCEGVTLGGDLEFLQEACNDPNGPEILLCLGYCGWGPDKLDQELLNGEWFLHKASKELIFNTPPEKIWQTALRDMGGKYAPLSLIPTDLSLN
ncbi:MAG: YqgE/AlgH family protein [Simkaniaceae bacterium]|nr:YqgE/AlgH family protein [Simkaniaceae bacterium]